MWPLKHPARAMSLNPPMVFGNVAIVLASTRAARTPKTWSRDAWLVVGGLTIFTVTALYETVRGGIFGRWSLEPFTMLVLIVCIGIAAANRVFAIERRVAAVTRELETARRIQQSILPKEMPAVDRAPRRVALRADDRSRGRPLRLRRDTIGPAGRPGRRRIGTWRPCGDHRLDGQDRPRHPA
jgi:hypothetical protein